MHTATARIDVVIAVRDMAATLPAAVESALAQAACRQVLIVDDASNDDSAAVASALAKAHPGRIRPLRRDLQGGAARARNMAIAASAAPLIAFLDADDVYEPQALDVAQRVLNDLPDLALVRLALRPVGLPSAYAEHPRFDDAWRQFLFTGQNMVIRRPILMAAGGFPEEEVFRTFGGEDGALSLALTRELRTGTLFDQPGVRYAFRTGGATERLLRSHLLGEVPPGLSEALPEADAVTDRIRARLLAARRAFEVEPGVVPITVTWSS